MYNIYKLRSSVNKIEFFPSTAVIPPSIFSSLFVTFYFDSRPVSACRDRRSTSDGHHVVATNFLTETVDLGLPERTPSRWS